jgi:hypothetical protein
MTLKGTFEELFESIFSKNDKFDSLNKAVKVRLPVQAARLNKTAVGVLLLCVFLFRHILPALVFASQFLHRNRKTSFTCSR